MSGQDKDCKMNRKILKSIFRILGMTFLFLFILVFLILVFSIDWMLKTWNHLTMDELLFHLQAPLEGTNQAMIGDYFKHCVLSSVCILGIYIGVYFFIKVLRKKYLSGIFWLGTLVCIMGTAWFSGIRFWKELNLENYFDKQSQYSQIIDKFYVDPGNVQITFPQKKRNLVYIYLESMETTYGNVENGGGFQENYIPELTKLAQENEDFSGQSEMLNGGYVLPGTGFTMGAMVAQSAGIPLKVSIDGNSMGTRKHFFSHVITLGDILEKQGYHQVLVLASEASFAAKDKFFREHGYEEIIDYDYAKENKRIPEDYRVWWGYEDWRSFDFAKEKMVELSKQKEPFQLTLLTVDTHFEDGYFCELCKEEWGDNQYANVLSCSSRQVSEFVDWISQQSFYENTTIVLVGDHTTMDTDFCDSVSEDYDRRIYTSYINSAVCPELKEKRNYTIFDYFPTTLASIGASIEGERLGLGTNLFSSEQTLLERFGIERLDEELEKRSHFMEALERYDE